MSLIDIMLSIFLIPSQCRTSGMRAWNRESFTPAIISVDLKYLSALSPPRLRKLYTRYLGSVSRSYDLDVMMDVLCYFSQSTTFFSEIYDDTDASSLGTTDALLNSKDKIRLASADIRPKDV